MSHFGSRPNRYYNSKLRYIVSALSTVVMVLLGLLFFILSSKNTSDKSIQKESGVAWAAQPNQVDVVVSRTRIEQGMLIDSSLTTMQTFPIIAMPLGFITQSRRDEVYGKYATQMIPAGAVIQAELLTPEPLLTSETIPSGMRAVTINVDSRAGVAGHVRPFSRVDILCTYDNKGSKEIGVVVPYAKVFSVNGSTSPTNQTGTGAQEMSSVTLIVKEEDALRIELARATGALSLNLVGNTTTVSNLRPNTLLTQKQLFGNNEPERVETVKIHGKMTMKSPRDNRMVTFVLTDTGWVDERDLPAQPGTPAA